MGLYTEKSSKKAEISKEEEQIIEHNKARRHGIMGEINQEATLYGLWLVNAIYLISFVFMSFVVFRFQTT